jgi:hypothetical protein
MAGLSFDDLGACIATMTRAGIRTEEVMTAINGVLIAFLKPTDEAIAAAGKFGLELNTTTLQTEGLTGVMEKLSDATAEQLAEIFPNIRGLKGMAAALGDAEGYARSYALMLESAGLTQEAFAKQSDTLNFKLDQLKAMFNIIKVTIGDALIPVVEDLTEKVMGALVKVKEWTEANKPLTETLVKWGGIISGVALVLGPLVMLLPGFVKNLGIISGWLTPLSTGFAALALALGVSSGGLLLVLGGLTAVGLYIGREWSKALEEGKRIQEMQVKASEAQVKALEKLQKAYGLTEDEMGKVAENMREGKGLLDGILDKTDKYTGSLNAAAQAEYERISAQSKAIESNKEAIKSFEDLDAAVLNSIITGGELSEQQEDYMALRQRMSDIDRTATQVKIDDLDRECIALLANMETNLMTMEQIDEYRQVMLDHIIAGSSERQEHIRNLQEVEDKLFELEHTQVEVRIRDLEKERDARIEDAKEAMLSAEKRAEAIEKFKEACDKEKASILELAIARTEKEIASLDKAIELRKEQGELVDELIKKRNAEIENLNKLKESYLGTATGAEKLATAEGKLKHKPPELIGAAEAGQYKVLNPQGGYEGVTSDPNALTAAEIAAGWTLVPLRVMGKGGLVQTFIDAINHLAAGGGIGTDTVPIMATPGEYVVKKQMVDFIRKTGMVTGGLVEAIQKGLPTPSPAFARGGMVGSWAGGQSGGISDRGIWGGGITFGKESVVINAKTLDDAAINEAGDKIMKVVHEKAKNAGWVFGRS